MIISDYTKKEKKLFLKDPETTELGHKILSESIKLIDATGFYDFNFKKLASRIDSTEASIYRYFENKYKLLFYLINWYWSWVKYSIDSRTQDIKDSEEKLKVIIRVICNSLTDDPETEHIDEALLSRIVITESTKAFTTKHVEADFQDGLFEAYKEVVEKISEVINAINSGYPKPKALAVSVIMLAHKQLYLSANIPQITDLQASENDTSEVEQFLEDLIFVRLNKSA